MWESWEPAICYTFSEKNKGETYVSIVEKAIYCNRIIGQIGPQGAQEVWEEEEVVEVCSKFFFVSCPSPNKTKGRKSWFCPLKICNWNWPFCNPSQSISLFQTNSGTYFFFGPHAEYILNTIHVLYMLFKKKEGMAEIKYRIYWMIR